MVDSLRLRISDPVTALARQSEHSRWGHMAWAHSVSLLLVLPLVFTLPASAETASQVFQQASPSVVVVLTYNAAGKPTELGSGVKLPDGSVATNCHVLKDGTTYRVRYRGKLYPASLGKADWNRDVCSLSVPGLPAPPVVLGSTRTLQVGAQV